MGSKCDLGLPHWKDRRFEEMTGRAIISPQIRLIVAIQLTAMYLIPFLVSLVRLSSVLVDTYDVNFRRSIRREGFKRSVRPSVTSGA